MAIAGKMEKAQDFTGIHLPLLASATIYAQQALALYPDGFLPLIKTDIKDYSFSAGLDGKLGKWAASLSNTLGVNNFDFDVDQSRQLYSVCRYSKSQNKI